MPKTRQFRVSLIPANVSKHDASRYLLVMSGMIRPPKHEFEATTAVEAVEKAAEIAKASGTACCAMIDCLSRPTPPGFKDAARQPRFYNMEHATAISLDQGRAKQQEETMNLRDARTIAARLGFTLTHKAEWGEYRLAPHPDLVPDATKREAQAVYDNDLDSILGTAKEEARRRRARVEIVITKTLPSGQPEWRYPPVAHYCTLQHLLADQANDPDFPEWEIERAMTHNPWSYVLGGGAAPITTIQRNMNGVAVDVAPPRYVNPNAPESRS